MVCIGYYIMYVDMVNIRVLLKFASEVYINVCILWFIMNGFRLQIPSNPLFHI